MPPDESKQETIASTEATGASSNSATLPTQRDLAGQILDERYLIEKELGHGGVGAVYLARDRKLHDKPVVMKVLLEQSLRDPWVLQKFQQEKEALARVDHPGVVGILDTGELPDGKPYIVMQYVEGASLRDAMRVKPEGMEMERAASILRQIGIALSAVHAKGIFHRDLKPENIMLQQLDHGEQVKIVDFGIAKVKESVIAPSTITGAATAGTIIYMSPEQLRAKKIGAPSDIYALGVIAYEMLTGRRPFNPETTTILSEMQREGVRVKPADLRPSLSDEAQAIILKALAFEPSDRYQRASEFGDALSRALLNEDETLKIESPIEIPATQRAPSAPVESQPAESAKTIPARFEPAPAQTMEGAVFSPRSQPKRRAIWPKLAVAIILIAALGAAGYFTISKWNALFGANKATNADASVQRSLVYSLTVQKFHDGKPYDQPFETSGQEIFENGWKFKMNIFNPQEGYLYLLNEGPAANGSTTYNMLFPEPKTNNGSPRVTTDQKLQTAWMRFDEHQGTEKFWIVWSGLPVKELDDVTGVVNAQQKGEVSEADQLKAVRDFLEKHSSPKPEVAKDSAGEKTTVKGKGEVLVSNVELKHN
ncbi:MAG: protein kinase [Pyrinomonadaceae bacterium]